MQLAVSRIVTDDAEFEEIHHSGSDDAALDKPVTSEPDAKPTALEIDDNNAATCNSVTEDAAAKLKEKLPRLEK